MMKVNFITITDFIINETEGVEWTNFTNDFFVPSNLFIITG